MMRWRTIIISTLLVGALPISAAATQPSQRTDVPVLVEEATSAGVKHRYGGPWEYFVGGGVAAFDCNGDRRPDLALAGGANQTRLFTNVSPAGGRLKFEELHNALPRRASSAVTGLYPLDVDNDRKTDLVVLRVGENIILKGRGDCTFTYANRSFSFDGGRDWTTAFAATFESRRRYPTLAFGNYVDRSAPGSPWGTCHDNVLLRPHLQDGRLKYDRTQPLSPGYCALSLLFTDWNRSGQPALRVSNDRQYYRGGQEQLWRLPDGRPARAFRSADGWRGVKIWGMGIAEADLDNDGLPEYALTSMGDTKLHKLDDADGIDRPVYRDIARDRGVTAHRPYTGSSIKPSTGWHAQFADLNNDARLDLFIAKGNVEQMPDFAKFDPDNLLLGQADGRFVEAGGEAGLALDRKGRGAAIVDLNMDGRLDIVVVNREAPVSIFRNTGGRHRNHVRPLGNWLQLELSQPRTNRHAVGAAILVKTGNHVQRRMIQVGGGHASGQLGFIHFGLATAERASVRVRWPDGEWSAPHRVFANNFVRISRGAPRPRYWYPHD